MPPMDEDTFRGVGLTGRCFPALLLEGVSCRKRSIARRVNATLLSPRGCSSISVSPVPISLMRNAITNSVSLPACSVAHGISDQGRDGVAPLACGRVTMFQPNPVTKTMLLCTTFANDNELKKFGEGCYVDLRIVCKTGPNGKQTPTQFVLTDIASGNDPSSFKMQKRDRTVVDVVITSKQSMGAGVLMKHDGSVDWIKAMYAAAGP